MLLSLAGLVLACGEGQPPARAQSNLELLALGAASLTDVLPRVAEAWEAQSGVSVTWSFDSSSKLARQVEAGAPADVLFFADQQTTDALDRQGLLAPGTRRDLLSNTLVAVVPADAPWAPAGPAELADERVRHLALAGENVPAGRYARAALETASVWTSLQARVVAGDNVRTTLAWVARGEAEAGVVYATDARAEPGVRTAFSFPEGSHPPIVYPAAVLASSAHREQASALLDFCGSPAGRALFAEAGFAAPPEGQ